MADLLRGGQPPGSAGAGRAQNGGARAGPVPVSTHPASGVRTPTDVMRARRDREARKKAEQEALQRQQEQDELRQLQDEEVPSTSRRQGRQAVADPQTQDPAAGGRRPESISQSAQPAPIRQRQQSMDQGQPRPTQAHQSRATSSGRFEQPSVQDDTAQPTRTRAPRPRPAVQETPSMPAQVPPPAAVPPQAQPSAQGAQPSAGQRSAFPHAFERWETLSSHWEGLTSYWIRRLQENSNELNREPLNQQMARQITDLSAAGANLFHAVVELQRLRASSERKFQRWFFETRAEQERFQEAQSEIQRQLEDERRQRLEAINNVGGARSERVKAEEMVKEMKRELQISKEEARRAWEELGRREQEERDRTTSLRNGEPTLVGGVQVVPMTHGVSSRQQPATTQRPATRENDSYAGGSVQTTPQQQRRGNSRVESPQSDAEYDQGYTYDQPSVSSAQSESYEGSAASGPDVPHYRQQGYIQPSPGRTAASPARGYNSQTTTSAPSPQHFYHHGSSAETSIHQPTGAPTTNGLSATAPAPAVSDGGRSYIPSTVESEEGYPEEDYEMDEQGNVRFDAHGRPIPYRSERPFSDEGSDDYDVQEQIAREQAYRQQYLPSTAGSTAASSRPHQPVSTTLPYETTPSSTSAAPSSRPPQAGTSSADYTGAGWGGPSSTGWESITPRHRHPTRLSDVLEEDERSRATSPSRRSGISGR